ncbi:MAG TPA: DUF1501 domain-containing protein [Polyangiales bacterium]|nr:DUF1501 domain-containing protein [Polyangiales bacterium]
MKLLGLGTAGAAFARGSVMRALAQMPPDSKDFFVVIHQAGGWDVTLWADPRNQVTGLMNPATTDTCTVDGITGWVNQALDDGDTTFQLVEKGNYQYGPALGSLLDLYDRMTVINGIAMNTVSHPDGTYFSSTGRHLAGGRAVASSIDTMLGNELGVQQLLPVVSVNFPSSYIGSNLDGRAMPLRVSDITSVAKSINRSTLYDSVDDRNAVTALLADEARGLAGQAFDPSVFNGMADQYGSLQQILGDDSRALFDATKLKMAHPNFAYTGKNQGSRVINASFAIEAIRRRMVRVMSFQMSSCDTHNANYKNHPMILQETFEMISTMVKEMDAITFDDSTDKLSDYVHILVISEFCRTPQINLSGGRDHYPNNSALIISPKFKGNFQYGKSDPDQLLPLDSGTFTDGSRAITPADVLATFVGAVGIDPRKYMRDGEVVKDLLR